MVGKGRNTIMNGRTKLSQQSHRKGSWTTKLLLKIGLDRSFTQYMFLSLSKAIAKATISSYKLSSVNKHSER